MKEAIKFLKGIAIGAGAILPGVSSGVLCVIFGIYEELLNKVLNLFKDFKNNFRYLFPITAGACCGIVLFGNILQYLFDKYPFQTSYLFIGLVLGSLPKLFSQVKSKFKFKMNYILYLLLACTLGIAMVYLEGKMVAIESSNVSFWYLVCSGIAMSVGVIVPGVSSTIILMLFGVYNTYLMAVSGLYFPVLIPIGIGLLIGSVICMKITKVLLDKFYAQTFYAIIGFTLGSILVLYPGFYWNLNGIIAILCLTMGWVLASLLE